MSFLNGHLQRRVSHRERDELLPVLRARQSPGGLQSFVKRCCGQRGEQAKNGQSRRPRANFSEGALRDSYGVVVHAENKGSDGIHVSLGEPLEHGGILTRLVEALVYVRQVRGINRLHADEDPLTARSCNKVHEFLVTQQIRADLAALASGPGFQEEQLVHHAFVGAEADGVSEKAGYRAELTAVRTAAP